MRRLREHLGLLAFVLVACSASGAPKAPAPLPRRRRPTPAWMKTRVPPLAAPLPGTTGLSAASCGGCHAEIAAEWRASTHAHAWVDAQFQQELAKDPQVAWLCINCHTPLANQQAQLSVPGATVRSPVQGANPLFDPALQAEGVTCLSCHWRPEGIATPHANVAAPHPTVFDPELRTEASCTGCHQAVARLEDALVCTFNTGAEWSEARPGKSCPDCHMPRVDRPSVAGGKVRDGARHGFPGSLIPKDAWSPEEAAVFADWKPGVEARVELGRGLATGGGASPQVATVLLENVRAGHMVPTGDPERYLELNLEIHDATGQPVATEQWRLGQQWEWWPVARKLGDNRLAPGEIRRFELAFPPLEGGGSLHLSLDHVRISPENHAHHKLGAYPARRRVQSLDQRVPPTR